MSFLAPLSLLMSAAIAVPLIIHLLRRRLGARVEFPAARYLARAEKEHSRTLRIRNILLMVLRVVALLAIVVAAARPVARWVGAGHAPTAIAIVVDNSLSSSAVVNGRPLLDQFRAMARDVVASSTAADRVWLITIDGRVTGGSAGVLRDAINRLEPIAGAGDPATALSRAAGVVRASGLGARQVALVTDGQRSEWQRAPAIPNVQMVVYAPFGAPPPNRAVVLAEARPARWTPRGAVVARVVARDSTTYRMTLEGRTFARGTAAPNEDVVVRASPPERGWVAGTVELEPDELPGDNVRYFSAWIGPAPAVTVAPSSGAFVKSAVDVLRSTERITDGRGITVTGAEDLSALPALITAPADPVRLGAANRALERLGIPWRFGARRSGASTVRGAGLDGVNATIRYALVAQTGAAAETLAVAGGDAWAIAGARYVIVASPLVPEATNLPVRAAFIPWIGSVLTERLVGEPGQVIDARPGTRLARPRWADAMETADGQRTALADPADVPARSGVYFLTRDGRRVGALVVNPTPDESMLDRYTSSELSEHLRSERTLVAPSASAWSGLAFRAAARRSLVGPALMAALVLLTIEAIAIRARGRRAA